jgi:O-acetyl-ADP-ribose deacetylase (regulator of RNase III)
MHLHLVDTNSELVAAWRDSFASFDEVAIQHGDILSLARHALVSPANSNGFMDGGIDRQYAEFFGAAVQNRVLEVVRARPEGHLPVGASAIVGTDHPDIPFLILAPTMFAPDPVPPSHAYRALRAVLRLHGKHVALNGDVYCPGLATLIGRVSPKKAASEMAEAYRDWRAQ